jgi:hypothetical protein
METKADQLKLLMDYTLFHIGLYTTLISALLALAHFSGKRTEHQLRICISLTVICFSIAGAAGGAIASNIPNYSTFLEFDRERLKVFGFYTMPYRYWGHVEHAAFWFGFIITVGGFLYCNLKRKTMVNTCHRMWAQF